nr:hypothetical protein [Tanacetum cinerariifolium]
MVSAVICLSTSRKFNFSKYIFDSLVRNIDSTTKFYMCPCFLQLLIRKQVGDLSTHTTKHASPTLTHKVFANIRRVRKGFSGVETPLFEGMLVGQEIEEEGDADEHVEDVTAGDDAQGDDTAAHGEVLTITQEPSIPSPTPTIPPSQPPQDIPSTSQVTPITSEVLDACAALTRRVEHLEYDKVAEALEIIKLKRRVKKLEKENKARVLKLRRLQGVGTSQRVDTSNDTVMDDESNKGRMIDEIDKDGAVVLMDEKEEDKKVEEAKVAESAQVAAAPSRRRKRVVIRDPEEESTTSSIISTETKSKDKGKRIMVEEPKPLKKKQQIEMDEEYARKLHAEINKDIDWDVAIDHVKLKAKEDPAVQRYQVMKRKSQTEAQAQKNMMMYLKNVAGFKLQKEQIKEEENRALQSINETPAQKAAKRRKLNEEVKDLKRHLEIMPDEYDDVYTEATLLARKVPVLDYEIIELNNKPYYKIIRADETYQLYISFLTLLKNFDREDLEAL